MLNQSNRSQFSAALAERGVNVHQAHVAGHDNTLQAFISEWGKPKRVFRASNGVEVLIWQNLKKKRARRPATSMPPTSATSGHST